MLLLWTVQHGSCRYRSLRFSLAACGSMPVLRCLASATFLTLLYSATYLRPAPGSSGGGEPSAKRANNGKGAAGAVDLAPMDESLGGGSLPAIPANLNECVLHARTGLRWCTPPRFCCV